MKKTEISSKSKIVAYKSVKITLKTIKKSIMVINMTMRKITNMICSWCDEFEHIVFIEKV